MWNIYIRLQVLKYKNTVSFIAFAVRTPNLACRVCICRDVDNNME